MVDIITYIWVALRGIVRPKKRSSEGEPMKYERREIEDVQRMCS